MENETINFKEKYGSWSIVIEAFLTVTEEEYRKMSKTIFSEHTVSQMISKHVFVNKKEADFSSSFLSQDTT